MDDRLFDRPRRRDPIVRVWVGVMALAALLTVPQYVDWGQPYNPDRAAELVAVLLLLAVLLWLLLFVPALLRRSTRRARSRNRPAAIGGDGWGTGRGVPFGPVPSGRTGSTTDVTAPAQPAGVHASWVGSGSPHGRTYQVDDPLAPGDRRADPEHVDARPPRDDDDTAAPGAARPQVVHLDLRPLGELKMLTVAARVVREGEPVRLDWDFTDADEVLVDGLPQSTSGGCYVTVNASRDVLVQGFQGDRLLHSVRVPVVVEREEPEPEPFDWFGPAGEALHRVIAEREERRAMSERARARNQQYEHERSEARARAEHEVALRAATRTSRFRRGLRRSPRRRAQETSDA